MSASDYKIVIEPGVEEFFKPGLAVLQIIRDGFNTHGGGPDDESGEDTLSKPMIFTTFEKFKERAILTIDSMNSMLDNGYFEDNEEELPPITFKIIDPNYDGVEESKREPKQICALWEHSDDLILSVSLIPVTPEEV